MKRTVLGLLILVFLGACGTTPQIPTQHRPLVAFSAQEKKEAVTENKWKICGDYFLLVETTEGNMVIFAFKPHAEQPRHLVFTLPTNVDNSILPELAFPVLTEMRKDGTGPRIKILMNVRDYTAALPCFAKGEKT